MKKNAKKKWDKPRIEQVKIKNRNVIFMACDKASAAACAGLQDDYSRPLSLIS